MCSQESWEYRGEGNASIVVSNNETHMVYRLKKKKCGDISHYVKEHVEKSNSFLKHVILPSFSPAFVRIGQEVAIEEGFWDTVPAVLQGKRPLRRQNSEVDIEQTTALTLPDLCFVVDPLITTSAPTLAIEIKCKKGFLPSADILSDKSKLKSKVCRFCIHQETKVKQGTWDKISSYCPIDLFSGEPARMRHAFGCLLRTPQNNLRIFNNGVMVWGQDVKSQDVLVFEEESLSKQETPNQLVELLIRCLCQVPGDWKPPSEGRLYPRQTCHNSSYTNKYSCNAESEIKPGCILERLLHLQMLDDWDVEGVLPLYHKIIEHFQHNPHLRDELHLDGPYDDDGWDASAPFTGSPDNMQFAVNKVKQFMISATAKDSSIMMALQPLTRAEYERAKQMPEKPSCQLLAVEEGKHRYYQYTISLVDLDPKDWTKIPKYCEQDEEIVRIFMENRPDFVRSLLQ